MVWNCINIECFFGCRRWGCTPPCPRYGSSWHCSSCWCTCSRGAAIATPAENAASPPGSGYWVCLRSSAGEWHAIIQQDGVRENPPPAQNTRCENEQESATPTSALVINIARCRRTCNWNLKLSVGGWLVHVITAAVNANVERLVSSSLFRQQLIWIISRASALQTYPLCAALVTRNWICKQIRSAR